MKRILVIATAMRTGGALSILNQFIEYASLENEVYFDILVHPSFEHCIVRNCKFTKIPLDGWLSRIIFDSFTIRKIIYNSDYQYDCVLSLQNTTLRTEIKQFVYLHQPLPFSDFKGNIFSKNDFKLYLYKYFYKFFIDLYARKDTHFIVQTESMSKALSNDGKIVSVYGPKVESIITDESVSVVKGRLFYPSSPISYKNHKVILESIYDIDDRVEFLVTFSRGDFSEFDLLVAKLGLEDKVIYLGYLERDKMNYYYNSSELIVFPSVVETFGLPLLEAASIGKPIICSDLGYARDVVGNYSGAKFLDPNDVESWRRLINKVLANDNFEKYESFCRPGNSWKEFFYCLTNED